MPPTCNRSRRNSMGIQNEYGDDLAANFADLFGTPEDLGTPEARRCGRFVYSDRRGIYDS
eukprot:scaffold101695_cov36-Cyclotella_meneghiniana.AAC.1